jgi:Fe-S-cluster-containing dehydrogenase component
VKTACQAACPTQAITFGNMAESGDITERKNSPLTYALLEEQNTKPRVTYKARITNPTLGTGARPRSSRLCCQAAITPT